MDECKKIILNHSPYIKNCPTHLKPRQKISFVLQHKERELLKVMVEEIQKQNIPIISLKHDGILIRKKMNVSVVEKSVQTKTGIQMKIDSKRI